MTKDHETVKSTAGGLVHGTVKSHKIEMRREVESWERAKRAAADARDEALGSSEPGTL